jgi:hypothetical protein
MAAPFEEATRREFGKTLVGLAVAPMIVPIGLAVADEPKPGEFVPPANQTDALLAVVQHRFGQFLSPDQLKEVRKSIEESLKGAERLRKFPLKNGDEPAFTFHA